MNPEIMSSIEEVEHLRIPLVDILLATNKFDDKNFIGIGGFGRAYQGPSPKYGALAVKRLSVGTSLQGQKEFMMEIALLSAYKHDNLVSLVGFCDQDGEKILVYKHESNGSLDKLLKSKDLDWIQRLQICLDAARGLKDLHDDVGSRPKVVHGDIKSANILLGEEFKGKILDFGLSKINPVIGSSSILISNACGTLGYIDPEYVIHGVLTEKSDIYSFGVVLFEVLCGRLAQIVSYQDKRQFLCILAQDHFKKGTMHELVEPQLQKQMNATSLKVFSTIAHQCLKSRDGRPTMIQVVEELQKALDHQLLASSGLAHNANIGSGNQDVPNKTCDGTRDKVKKKGPQRIPQQQFKFLTKSEFDYLEDGYSWRKYGKKAVKNNIFPRSYFRCPISTCTVKKTVQRSSTDPTIVITTYEGQHCHDGASIRQVVPPLV